MNNKYSDILNSPRPNPKYHQRMPLINRAAQFAPFSALSGYEASINEAKRVVEKKKILTLDEKRKISDYIKYLLDEKEEQKVLITYFVKDEKKDGGSYYIKEGVISKFDLEAHSIVLKNKMKIKINDILKIEGKNSSNW